MVASFCIQLLYRIQETFEALKYIIIHFITGLNKLIKKLDRRHEKHMVKKKTPGLNKLIKLD